jgi:hypothetical protein
MSLNKRDLDSFRRAKRHRAQKIDLLIIVLFLLAAIFISLDHPQPRPGAPAFHQSRTEASVPAKTEQPVIARAQN